MSTNTSASTTPSMYYESSRLTNIKWGVLDVLQSFFKKLSVRRGNTTNSNIDIFLHILAGVGVVQVIGQDFGIITPQREKDMLKNRLVQTIMFFAAAYYVTKNLITAALTLLIYGLFKYFYSSKEE